MGDNRKRIAQIRRDLAYHDETNADYADPRDDIRFMLKRITELEAILNRNNPWSLRAVLRKLAESADILLNEKDYDGHGYEEIVVAREVGRALALKIKELHSDDADSAASPTEVDNG